VTRYCISLEVGIKLDGTNSWQKKSRNARSKLKLEEGLIDDLDSSD
jgi:hypothetical protein